MKGNHTAETAETQRLIADTVRETIAAIGGGQIDYYKSMERLLYNYKRIAALVADADEYCSVELHEKSTSIVRYTAGGAGESKMPDELIDEARAQRVASYMRTKARYDEIDRVIKHFAKKKEFAVIRMYYFNENADGSARADGSSAFTWEDITTELEALGLLHDIKTARRWRNNIINDMAVCMFGANAALSRLQKA